VSQQQSAIPEPWFSFLKALDELVTIPVRLDCIGGFVVTVLYGLGRTTGDLDVLEIAPRSAADAFAKVAMRNGELHRKYGLYLTLSAWHKRPTSMRVACVKCSRASFSISTCSQWTRMTLHSPNWNAISNAIVVTCAIWRALCRST
jgi:hypothetical protein